MSAMEVSRGQRPRKGPGRRLFLKKNDMNGLRSSFLPGAVGATRRACYHLFIIDPFYSSLHLDERARIYNDLSECQSQLFKLLGNI